eukprot:1730006-Alexandrium_andersonii.AAC.1
MQPRAHVCAARRARYAAGTQRGAWECSRHAVRTHAFGMQTETRVFGTRVLGKHSAHVEHARALRTATRVPSMLSWQPSTLAHFSSVPCMGLPDCLRPLKSVEARPRSENSILLFL